MHREKRFSLDQKKRLRTLGLIEEQIAALEGVCLWCIGFELHIQRDTPPVGDVRRQLRRLSSALTTARIALKDLRAPNAASRDAHTRFVIGSWGVPGALDIPNHLSEVLDQGIAITKYAIGTLPKGSVRHKTATPRTILTIDDALKEGWRKGRRATPYPKKHRASNSPGSVFREVISICFEAVGAKTVDPERAIRTYKATLRQNRPVRCVVPS